MSKDLFEKALKDNYPNSATDLDLDAAWNALEARRKKPRRRGLIWFFAGTALLLCGLAAWWWTGNNIGGAPSSSAIVEINETEQAQQATQTGDMLAAATPDDISAASPSKALVAKSVASPRPLTVPTLKDLQAPTSVRQASPKSSAPLPVATLEIPPANQYSPVTPLVETSTDEEKTAPVYTHELIDPLDQKTIAQLSRPITVPALELYPMPVLKKKRKAAKTTNWTIGAQSIYGFNWVDRQGDQPDLASRAAEESSLDLMQFGLNIRRHFKGHWFVETGAQFAQWTDVRRSVTVLEHAEIEPNLLLRQVIQANGVVEEFYGPGTVIVRQRMVTESYNRYQHLELPLMAGKIFPLGKSWKLECAVGGNVILTSWYSGSAHMASSDVPLNELPYRKSGMLSAQSQLSLLYRTKLGSIGFSVAGRTGLGSQTQSGAEFKEQRSSVGFGLVFRHELRKR